MKRRGHPPRPLQRGTLARFFYIEYLGDLSLWRFKNNIFTASREGISAGDMTFLIRQFNVEGKREEKPAVR